MFLVIPWQQSDARRAPLEMLLSSTRNVRLSTRANVPTHYGILEKVHFTLRAYVQKYQYYSVS